MDYYIDYNLFKYGILTVVIVLLFKLYLNKLEKIEDTINKLNNTLIELKTEIKTLIYVMKNNKK